MISEPPHSWNHSLSLCASLIYFSLIPSSQDYHTFNGLNPLLFREDERIENETEGGKRRTGVLASNPLNPAATGAVTREEQ